MNASPPRDVVQVTAVHGVFGTPGNSASGDDSFMQGSLQQGIYPSSPVLPVGMPFTAGSTASSVTAHAGTAEMNLKHKTLGGADKGRDRDVMRGRGRVQKANQPSMLPRLRHRAVVP